MTIESIPSSLIVAIYKFTSTCIDQRDGLCLHSLHGGIFRVLSDVWSVCTI